MNQTFEPKRSPWEAGFTIGFIGGGQLARMSALEAFRFGMNIAVFATSKATEPVENMTPTVVRGSLSDENALTEFASKCDVITLENEFVDSDILRRVSEKTGTPILPAPNSFRLIEDKLIEKQTFQNAGIPVAPFMEVASDADLNTFAAEYGYPFVLKSAKGGYDGYGNATAHSHDEAVNGLRMLSFNGMHVVIAEAFVPFTMELAVMVARNKYGVAVYPCVESIQESHICKEIIVPARTTPEIRRQAQELAIAAIEAIDGVGLFGFEFFLTHDNTILLNESAPRPHNSGHYTIEACTTSQFENHIRAVCQMPLGSAEMICPSAVMINILGTQNGSARADGISEIMQTNNAHLHIYGKSESRVGRKMAHLTVLGADPDKTLTQARNLAKSVTI